MTIGDFRQSRIFDRLKEEVGGVLCKYERKLMSEKNKTQSKELPKEISNEQKLMMYALHEKDKRIVELVYKHKGDVRPYTQAKLFLDLNPNIPEKSGQMKRSKNYSYRPLKERLKKLEDKCFIEIDTKGRRKPKILLPHVNFKNPKNILN